MSDKSPNSISLVTNFLTGESPTATKMSVMSQLVQSATRKLESYLGDPRGESAPYSTGTGYILLNDPQPRDGTSGDPLSGATERTLDIANIARLIGPASMLNPRSLEANIVTQTIPAGVTEVLLDWPVDATSSGTDPRYLTASNYASSGITVTDANAGTYHEGLSLFTAYYDKFTIDIIKGVLYLREPSAGGTIEYPVDPLNFLGGYNYPGARFNVIPDPNQLKAGTGDPLTITGPVSGRYTIQLPTIGSQQSNQAINSIDLDENDINFGIQLQLPSCLDDLSVGDIIPNGFVLLKNIQTNKVYDGATYYWNSPTELEVYGIDLTGIDPEVLTIITVGTDITSSIDDLRLKSRHAHDRRFGEPLVDIKNVGGFRAYTGAFDSAYLEEDVPSNFAPQYVHRDAYAPNSIIKQTIKGFLATQPTYVDPEDVAAPEDFVESVEGFPANYTKQRGASGLSLGALTVGMRRKLLVNFPSLGNSRDLIAITGPKINHTDYDYFMGVCLSSFGQSHLAFNEAQVNGVTGSGQHANDYPIRLAFISKSLTLSDTTDISSGSDLFGLGTPGYTVINIENELGIAGHRVVAINGMIKGNAGGYIFGNWLTIGGMPIGLGVGGTIPGTTGMFAPDTNEYTIYCYPN